MARVERTIAADPETVFTVLADGWTYSDWVVGTAHIRDVEPTWPSPGSKIHHKVGPWPVSIRDTSESLACQRPNSLLLKVRIWPLGAGHVQFTLLPCGEGATRVTMREDFTAGPLRRLRTRLNDLALHARNVETLRRLDDLATRRAPSRPA